jgi:L-ascorbate metabolism protein UlaG (beta-lactamase superfamily)
MQIEITYIFHNCFIVKHPARTFLFDYPADEFLDEARRAAIISKIQDTDLYLFSSHNHHDHFNRNSLNLGAYTKSLTCVLSKDIIKSNRQYRDCPSCYKVEADQSYTIQDFTVDTFRSNDEGVAFLLHLGETNLYFGGDLANWDWDDNTKEEHRFLVEYFGEVLQKLKKWPIQIAFSNADQRLPNWTGAAQFIEIVKPGLFVPMHVMGETELIGRFLNENPNLGSKFFQYRETGDAMSLEVETRPSE